MCLPAKNGMTAVEGKLTKSTIKQLQKFVLLVRNGLKGGEYRELEAWQFLDKQPELIHRDTNKALALAYLSAQEALSGRHPLSVLLFECLNLLTCAKHNSPMMMIDLMKWKDNKSLKKEPKMMFVKQEYANQNKHIKEYWGNDSGLKKRSFKLMMWVVVLVVVNIAFYFSGYSRYSNKNFRGEQYLADLYDKLDRLEQAAKDAELAGEHELVQDIGVYLETTLSKDFLAAGLEMQSAPDRKAKVLGGLEGLGANAVDDGGVVPAVDDWEAVEEKTEPPQQAQQKKQQKQQTSEDKFAAAEKHWGAATKVRSKPKYGESRVEL